MPWAIIVGVLVITAMGEPGKVTFCFGGLGGLEMGCPAGDVAWANDLLSIFLLVNQKFDSIKVNHPVANDSANADWCDIV